ncbi:hypothetical protein SOM70_34220 [Streptomyces salinarius]|uniref:hypothetical protein n=1 Tax=Streptomyces salinarius TaxID=2762598 RepID=UPI0032DF8C2B
MTYISAPWYQSSTFWTIFFGIFTALLGAVAGAWINNKFANPKRAIKYSWTKNVSLLHTSGTSSSTLMVQHSGALLSKPRVIDFALFNSGKTDITRDAFDNGDKIELNMDADVIEVLDFSSSPATAPSPSWAVQGRQVLISPGLIKSGQIIFFSCLVDGDARNPAARFPLVGIEPVEEDQHEGEPPRMPTRARRQNRAMRLFAMSMLLISITSLASSSFVLFVMATDEMQVVKKEICDSDLYSQRAKDGFGC